MVCLRQLCLLALIGLLGETDASAKLGLRTSLGEMRVEGLSVGQTYNLRSFRGLPYTLENGGDNAVEVQTEISQPVDKALREGYESIPDPRWIRVIPKRFMLPVGGSSYGEILVSIPPDPRWVGRRFQGVITSGSRGTGMISVAVRTHLLISTDSSLTVKKLSPIEIPEFEFDPPVLMLSDVPVGNWVNVEKDMGRAVRVMNTSQAHLKMGFKRVPFGAVKLPEGYEQAPRGVKFRLSSKTIKLKPGAIQTLGFEIWLPAQAYGKRYGFLIRGGVRGSPLELGGYVTVLIEAEKS